MDTEDITSIAIDCGIAIHRRLGPGMFESAYETVLSHLLIGRGLHIERQKVIPIVFDDLVIEQGFRADIVIENKVLIELKSIERLGPVHSKQVLTYLRFMDLPVGLLMNFGCETFRGGLKRIVNNHDETNNSRLRIHQ